jgi:hypothetical protein
MVLDLSPIPDGWFLWGLRHKHTRIVYRGEVHKPDAKEPWSAELQHVEGGKLTQGGGLTPQAALDAAVSEVELMWFDTEEER